MNLILFGYCANLAYVIHGNSFVALFDNKPCRFGMVYFGIEIIEAADRNKFYKVKYFITTKILGHAAMPRFISPFMKIYGDRVKRENGYGQ